MHGKIYNEIYSILWLVVSWSRCLFMNQFRGSLIRFGALSDAFLFSRPTAPQQVPPVAAKPALRGFQKRLGEEETDAPRRKGVGGEETKSVIQETEFLAAKFNLFAEPCSRFGDTLINHNSLHIISL